MKAFQAVMLLTTVLLTITSLFAPSMGVEAYRIELLSFTVYPDGMAHVRIIVSVNETAPAFSILLPGIPVLNLLVVDSSGTPLSFDLKDGNLTVYTLGVSWVNVEYDTINLTRKEGAIWTFTVNTPVPFKVVIPWNASVVGLSDAPLEVSILEDDRIAIKMPMGLHSVSYVIPPDVIDLRRRVLEAILKAQESILEARAEGRTEGLEEAENLLAEAKNLYEQKKYLEAEEKAVQSRKAAEGAEAPSVSILAGYALWIGAATLLAVVLTTVVVVFRRKGGLDKIIRENPWLDEDERNVLRILWVKGGAAFEADLREGLSLPKTTVWRIVKKLEREGLIEVEKVRGENYVKLRRS